MSMQVVIRIRGHLRADWFDALTIHNLSNGEGVIAGQVADQAALLGILNRLHVLNLRLLAVWHFQAGETPSGLAESGEEVEG